MSRADEAFAALVRAELFVAEIEGRDIDPETAMPNYAHAPAIATARAVLRDELRALGEALDDLFHDAAWHGHQSPAVERAEELLARLPAAGEGT